MVLRIGHKPPTQPFSLRPACKPRALIVNDATTQP